MLKKGFNPAQHLFYIITISFLVLDQLTKALAIKFLEGGSKTIISDFFKLNLVLNKGAAFGMMPDSAPLFIVLALVALFVIVKLKKDKPQSKLFTIGLGLLAGGACGNLIDRLTRTDRAVVDFLDFKFGSYSYPTFNLADAGIVIGIILVFIFIYIIEKQGIYLGRNKT